MFGHFRHYLIATLFIVRTDHEALTPLNTMKAIGCSIPVALTHPKCVRVLPMQRYLQQFEEAAPHSDRTTTTHAHRVLGGKSGHRYHAPTTTYEEGK
ncbi:unnamed protein product [Taenia asiatica]|uniref:Secreted protein n=1 Tax=Taenia asiatica TaxID=60517 RepID=A0A0R3VZ37_TAEAS|nr:unnamed protein product [Taenia asiatica]